MCPERALAELRNWSLKQARAAMSAELSGTRQARRVSRVRLNALRLT